MTSHEAFFADLKNAVLRYEADECEKLAIKALEEKIDPLKVVEALTEAITEVGDAFGRGDIFLPELIIAGEAVKRSQAVLDKELKKMGHKRKAIGRFLVGTVAGDIHDIGKNIVAALFEASGFEVIDLGIDVSAEKFMASIKEHQPDLVGLSALLTTTAPQQKEIIESIKKAGMREKTKVIVGGGAITQDFADLIGADGYAATAPAGVEIAKKLMGIG